VLRSIACVLPPTFAFCTPIGMGFLKASMEDHEGEDDDSMPRYVWTSWVSINHPTTGNQMTIVGGAVAEKLFHRAKFVDRTKDLMYDEKKGSICKFVTTSCNLQ
jgi:hypothetical protein